MSTTKLGHDALRFLNGSSSSATSLSYADKILTKGQPMYLTDRNYLFVGDGETLMQQKKPICAPSIEGFVGDWDENSDYAISIDNNPNNEYYIKVFDDTLVIKAPKLSFDTTISGLLATSSELGFVKLGSDTLLTKTILSPSNEDNRTYPVQLNANNQMGVTVPFPGDEKVKVEANDSNEARVLLFGLQNPTSGTVGSAYYKSSITVNPYTNTITCTNFAGNATSATKVGVAGIWIYPEGNNQINIGGTGTGTDIFIGAVKKDNRTLPTDYWFNTSAVTTNPNYNPNVTLHCKASLADYASDVDPTRFYYTPTLTSGTELGKISINGEEKIIYGVSNSDSSVTQTKSDTTSGVFPILFTRTASLNSTKTEGVRYSSAITISPTTNTITCANFAGNATSATLATTAINVSGGYANITTLTASGVTTLNNALNVNGNVTITGDMTITGNITASGNILGAKVFGSVWT